MQFVAADPADKLWQLPTLRDAEGDETLGENPHRLTDAISGGTVKREPRVVRPHRPAVVAERV